MKEARFVVEPELVGERLDRAIAAKVPGLSRAIARKLLALGGVFVDGKRTKRESKTLFLGQKVSVRLGALELEALAAEAPPSIPILFEDDDTLVIDKPSGVFSAPTPESDLHTAFSLLSKPRKELFLVHRLDRPTSGVMLFAKTKAAAAHFGALFSEHDLEREYLALLGGVVAETVEVDLEVDGRSAKTRFTPLDATPLATLVSALLFSGRTHQIRIHAESIERPVLGDSKYGRLLTRGIPKAPRLALHATRLRLVLPSGELRAFESPLPQELEAYFEQLKSV